MDSDSSPSQNTIVHSESSPSQNAIVNSNSSPQNAIMDSDSFPSQNATVYPESSPSPDINVYSEPPSSTNTHPHSPSDAHPPNPPSKVTFYASSYSSAPSQTSGTNAALRPTVDKTSLLRAAMDKRIQDMVDASSEDKIDGKVYIIYERLGDFQWLPGKGDGEFMRRIKHWRLVIQLGFDSFTLEFLENSIASNQGVMIVGVFDQKASENTTQYHVADLKGLSTEVLYKWIQEQSKIWTEYNLLKRNCQHFVHEFLDHFEKARYLTRTGHLQAAGRRNSQPSSEQQQQSQTQEHLNQRKLNQQDLDQDTHPPLSQFQGRLNQQQMNQQEQSRPYQNHCCQDQQCLDQQFQGQRCQDPQPHNQQYENKYHHQRQQEYQQQHQQYKPQKQSVKGGQMKKPSSSPSVGNIILTRFGRIIEDIRLKSKVMIPPTPKRKEL